jgi:hypothetical protein
MTIRIHKEHLKQELFSPEVISISLIFALLYLFITTLLLNIKLLGDTVMGNYTLQEKGTIFFSLLQGVTTLYTLPELLLLLLLGLLMGANFVLLGKTYRERKKRTGDVSLGLGVLAVVATTGCASCGLTLFSLIGPGISLSLLPFQGIAQGLSLILLTASLIHTVNRRRNGCIIARL